MKTFQTILLQVITLCLLSGTVLSAKPLDEAFFNPPDKTKPWVFWFWINGNISKEGITNDLEAMKAQGINGVMWMEVSGKHWAPEGPVKGGTPEWLEMMRFAIIEADRLGMEFGLSVSFGYGSGGPWITQENAMKKLVWTETRVPGGKEVRVELPKPESKINLKRFNGQYNLKEDYKSEDDFRNDINRTYKDIGAFAVKVEAGQVQRIKGKDLANLSGLGWNAFPKMKGGAGDAIPRAHIVDLSAKMSPKGTLSWTAPEGDWVIFRLGHMANGKLARPCPVAAIGPEADRLNPKGMDAHFENHLKPILDAVGDAAGRTLKYIHIDSWEAHGQNWSKGFAEEFKKRRGYAIEPWLPTLTGAIIERPEMTERFYWDLRQTVNEVMLSNYIDRLKTLAKPYGVEFSSEPYGTFSMNSLTYGGRAELPVAEFWTGRQAQPEFAGYQRYTEPADFIPYCYHTMKAMASVANTYGRPRVGAEAFTGARAWFDHPWMLMRMGNEAFAQGINLFIFHLYAHQPYEDMVPGITHRKWGQHMNRYQPWWDYSKPYFDYLARAQAMLQQGRTVTDIAYLVTEDSPVDIRGSQVAFDRPRGYDFDFCTPEIIQRMEYKNGRIHLPSGASYRYLLLPKDGKLTLDTAKKIEALHKAGAQVIRQSEILGTPGLEGYPKSDLTVRKMGKAWPALPDGGWSAQLAADDLKPDFTGNGIQWIHRRSGTDDIYFVANDSLEDVEQICTFRVTGKVAELWDPLTGDFFALPEATEKNGMTSIHLKFEPAQSWFVVFREQATPGRMNHAPFESFDVVQELDLDWELSFDEKWGSPEVFKIDALKSWSEHDDSLVKFYSGTGKYRARFEVDGSGQPKNLHLDLGKVAVVARVTLNGKDCGIAWKPPYRVDVSQAIKTGENILEIEVVNTWVNRLIGDEHQPLDSKWENWETLAEWPDWFEEKTKRTSGRYTFTSVRHYDDKTPLVSSGLLGPVTLISNHEKIER